MDITNITMSERSQILKSTYCNIPVIEKILRPIRRSGSGSQEEWQFLGRCMGRASMILVIFHILPWVVDTWVCLLFNNSLVNILTIWSFGMPFLNNYFKITPYNLIDTVWAWFSASEIGLGAVDTKLNTTKHLLRSLEPIH